MDFSYLDWPSFRHRKTRDERRELKGQHFLSINNINRNFARKGEIMNRGIVGNLVGFKSVMLFVLAFAVMFCPGDARAQDTLTFKDVMIDITGVSDVGIASASGILAATDVDNDIYGNTRDGKVSTAHVASVTQMGEALAGQITKPIVANLESAGSTSGSGDELVMMAIIEGVTASWVSSMKDGSIVADGKTGAQLLSDILTAEFDSRLFAMGTSSSLYSGLSPSNVTSINKPEVINAINGNVDSTTSALVLWDLKAINGLVVSATDSALSSLSLNATMFINGGDTPKHIGPSTLVGMEVGNSFAVFGTSNGVVEDTAVVGVANSIKIAYATDNTSSEYFTGTAVAQRITNPEVFQDSTLKVPFQFRNGDEMTLNLDMTLNETLDGEPDQYFGAGGSDKLELDAGKGSASSSGELKGAALSLSAQVKNGDSVISNSINFYPRGTTGNRIIDVSAAISDALITSSSYQKFTVVATFTDEIGAATNVSLTHAVDTAAPLVTKYDLKSSGSGTVGGDVGAGSLGIPTSNQAQLTLHVDGNGEQDNKASQWLHISVEASAKTSGGAFEGAAATWTTAALYDLGTLAAAHPVSAVTTGGALITAIPEDQNQDGTVDSADQISGAKVVISVTNTVNNVSIRNAGLVLSVSDDARNPAIVYAAPTRNADGTLSGSSSINQVNDATALINTLFDYFSVSTFSPVVVSNPIVSSTVEIDNVGPIVLNATLSVVGLPSGYWETGDPSSAFGLLRQTTEAISAPVNASVLTKLGYTAATGSDILSNPGILDVTRGTAADSGQAGSPLKLVVTFTPKDNSTYADEDLDEFMVPAASKSGVTLLNERFNIGIVSANIGYATKSPGDNVAELFSENKPVADRTSRWNLTDATIYGTGSSAVAYATFYDQSGIPKSDYSNGANRSSNSNVQVWVSDKANNFNAYFASKTSNTIVVDVSKPLVSFTGKTGTVGGNDFNLDDVSDGSGLAAAETIVLITNTQGMQYADLLAGKGVNLKNLLYDNGTPNDYSNAFLNSANVVGATAAEVRAGYTIIISATFQEPAGHTSSTLNTDHLFLSHGLGEVYFPYAFDLKDATGVDTAPGAGVSQAVLDSSSTLFGQQFKTITADFSDFVTGNSAKMVLPDASALLSDLNAGFAAIDRAPDTTKPGIGFAAHNSVIAATWFYYIDGELINYDIGAGQIRTVTITARDLSGNYSSVNVKIATADFNIPEVAILDYQLSIPNRGIDSTIIQRDSSYGSIPADKAALLLSQATANLNDASAFVYVKIGNGTNKGGPFTSTNYIQGDFRPLGGGLVNADLVTYAGGATVVPGSVPSNGIVYASFWTNTFTTSNDSGAAKNRKIVIWATGSSLGVGNVESSEEIQVDHIVPSVTVNSIQEVDENNNNTASSYDTNGDGKVRPGQVVSVTAYITADAADVANYGQIIEDIDTSEFGSSSTPTYENGFLWNSNTQYYVTWTFPVSSDATTGAKKVIVSITDAAGNGDASDSATINVLASKPTVMSTIVSASNFINYVTDTPGLRMAYRDIGQKSMGSIVSHNATGIVRAYDNLTVTAVININDSAYSDIEADDLYADFSDFSADSSATMVMPTQRKTSGSIVTATWENFIVQPNATSKDAGVVRITAINPAGVAAAGSMLSSVSIAVDNTAPEITATLTYYTPDGSNRNVISSPAEFNPAKNTYYAGVVVTATYADAATLADGWQYGFGPSLLHALLNDGTLQAASLPKGGTIAPWFSLTNNSFINDKVGLATPDFWAVSGKDGVWKDDQLSTDGPVIYSGSDTTGASALQAIRESTNTVLNIYYGVSPDGSVTDSMKVSPSASATTGRTFIMSVSDPIGNVASITLSPEVEIDTSAPTYEQTNNISDKQNGIAVNNKVKIDVKSVAGNKYQQAQYAGVNILRPTRVTNGTVLVAEFEVKDTPDASDPISVGINGVDFKASGFTLTNVNSNTALSPLPTGVSSFGIMHDGNHQGYTFDPNALSVSVISVTVELTVGAAASSYPVVKTNAGTAVDRANYIEGVNGGLTGKLVLEATDSMNNKFSSQSSNMLEIDNSGPSVVVGTGTYPGSSIFALADLASVNALSTVPVLGATNINAKSGEWLVWAATVVVDGTDSAHFPLDQFTMNWAEVYEGDTTRFETGSEYSNNGAKIQIASSTRTILFVTNTIKLLDRADSHDARRLTATLKDQFGNTTTSEAGLLAIGASGPNATELTLTVDGKPQTFFNNVEIGIGKAIDASTASFEIYPGAAIVVEATIVTISGEAPDNILLDASDLYPAGLKSWSDQLIPNVTIETAEGNIYARWEYITYDYTDVPGGIVEASKWISDQSVVNTLLGGSGAVYNGPITDITTVPTIDFWSTNAAGGSGTGDASLSESANNLLGLPGIAVQPGAAARNIAMVTVKVDDADSLFSDEYKESTRFAVDTQTPRASITYSVTRALSAANLFMSGPRIGFPSAPNLDTQENETFYNRVRVGDSVAVIVDITNVLIDGSGDDSIRTLPGTFPTTLDPSPFLSLGNASLIDNVTIDLSEFSSVAGNDNVSPSQSEFSLGYQSGTSGLQVITATFNVTVTDDLGLTAASSNMPRYVTPTLVDDAGNRPYDNIYDLSILRNMNDLSIDNTPPSISGSLEVTIISGTASLGAHVLTAGDRVEGGASITAGSVLTVTVTVTDKVDHPLDIMNNPNYGTFALTAENLDIPPANITIKKELMRMTGADSISVPFDVEVPSPDEGKSTLSFRFVVHATDTVGNYSSKSSNDSFKFDSNPNVDIYDFDDNLLADPIEIEMIANTPVTIYADALDVGGLAEIKWVTQTLSTGVSFFAGQLSMAVDNPDLTLDLSATNPQSAQWYLEVGAPVSASNIYPVLATAMVTDNLGNTNSTQAQTVTININQPPIIATPLAYTITTDGVAATGSLVETAGVGYDIALNDIREATITEGDVLALTVTAADLNVPADPVIFTVTGTALFGSVTVSEATYTDNGDGTLTVNLDAGYLALTGTDKQTSVDFRISAGEAATIAPDTLKVVVNIQAKSAVPVLSVISTTIDTVEVSDPTSTDILLPEGQTLVITLLGTDAGNEDLTLTVDTLPVTGVDYTFTSEAATSGIVNGTFTYLSGSYDASIGNHVSPIDPFLAKFIVKNSTNTRSLNRIVDSENVNQAPVISATATVTKNSTVVSSAAIADEGTVTANSGDEVTLEFVATDLDGDAPQMPDDPVVTMGSAFTSVFTTTNLLTDQVESTLTITIPSTVAIADSTVTVVYTAKDNLGNARSTTYTVSIVPTEYAPADVEELVIGQGLGGTTNVTIKDIMTRDVIGSSGASRGNFLATLGGGSDRGVYVSTGDVDGDGKPEFISSMGPITDTAIWPNMVIVKDANDVRGLVGNAFSAFKTGTGPTNYNGGDLRTAVGNFLGTTTGDQIAVAQGNGGNNTIRLYAYDASAAWGSHYTVVGQFSGLAGSSVTNNASGGLTIAAGDLDGDGKDELVVGQTPSNTSRTEFRVLDIDSSGAIENIATGVAFPGRRTQQGGGGIEIAVANLDGEGLPEIVFASMGNTQDYVTDTERNAYSTNVFTVQKPILDAGVIQPFTSDNVLLTTGGTNRYLDTFWGVDSDSVEINPSGAVSIAAIEASGFADGDELVVGTGAVYSIAGEASTGYTVKAVKPAPRAKFAFVKIDYDGSVISGYTAITGLGQDRIGYPAWIEANDPTSGALFVAAGNVTERLGEAR